MNLDHEELMALPVPEVARRIGTSARKVWRLIEDGEIRAIKIGEKGTRVLTTELSRYLLSLPPIKA